MARPEEARQTTEPTRTTEPRPNNLGLFTDRAKLNSYIPRLATQEQPFRFDMPTRFVDPRFFPGGTRFDDLTGLPTETGAFRLNLVSKCAAALAEGKNVALAIRDFDNLKPANDTISKPFGDAGIVADATDLVRTIGEIDFGDAEVVVTRLTGAADETAVWVFGISDADIERLKDTAATSNRTKRLSIDPPFTLTSSTAVISSKDENLRAIFEDKVPLLSEEQGESAAFTLYNTIHERAETKAKLLKIAKDLARLPAREASEADHVNEVINIFTESVGGTRISSRLLRTLLIMIRDETRLTDRKYSMNDEQFLASLELSAEEAAELSLEELRTLYYIKAANRAERQVDEELRDLR